MVIKIKSMRYQQFSTNKSYEHLHTALLHLNVWKTHLTAYATRYMCS